MRILEVTNKRKELRSFWQGSPLIDETGGDGFRLVVEALERYRRQHTDARAFLESEHKGTRSVS